MIHKIAILILFTGFLMGIGVFRSPGRETKLRPLEAGTHSSGPTSPSAGQDSDPVRAELVQQLQEIRDGYNMELTRLQEQLDVSTDPEEVRIIRKIMRRLRADTQDQLLEARIALARHDGRDDDIPVMEFVVRGAQALSFEVVE